MKKGAVNSDRFNELTVNLKKSITLFMLITKIIIKNQENI